MPVMPGVKSHPWSSPTGLRLCGLLHLPPCTAGRGQHRPPSRLERGQCGALRGTQTVLLLSVPVPGSGGRGRAILQIPQLGASRGLGEVGLRLWGCLRDPHVSSFPPTTGRSRRGGRPDLPRGAPRQHGPGARGGGTAALEAAGAGAEEDGVRPAQDAQLGGRLPALWPPSGSSFPEKHVELPPFL